ncbi:MAG: tRNA adenosine(34) deaminase TadA [Vicinamibacterales bacterium]
MTPDDLMDAALDEARRAFDAGEVPIGAVAVANGQIIARAFNQPIAACDPTAHAEVLVLREAARVTGNYRLTDVSVYVTIEPCLMCVGALVHARVREVVFGATEPKTGALVSSVRLLDIPGLNHRFQVQSGVREDVARELIQRFFQERRRPGPAAGL